MHQNRLQRLNDLENQRRQRFQDDLKNQIDDNEARRRAGDTSAEEVRLMKEADAAYRNQVVEQQRRDQIYKQKFRKQLGDAVDEKARRAAFERDQDLQMASKMRDAEKEHLNRLQSLQADEQQRKNRFRDDLQRQIEDQKTRQQRIAEQDKEAIIPDGKSPFLTPRQRTSRIPKTVRCSAKRCLQKRPQGPGHQKKTAKSGPEGARQTQRCRDHQRYRGSQ